MSARFRSLATIIACSLGVIAASLLAIAGQQRGNAAETSAKTTSRERLEANVRWLAAPERQGRGPGTDGIREAADWVASQFAGMGLSGIDGKPLAAESVATSDSQKTRADGVFQRFAMTLEAKLGPSGRNSAELLGPAGPDGKPRRIPLVLGKDFTPLAAGGSGTFDLPLAFLGYGISAPAEDYDDYAATEAASRLSKGSAAIILRQEPQKDDPHSVFDGNQASQHAALARKIANASEHEVGAVVLCNDTDAEGDALMSFTRAGDGSERRTMPVLHVRRAVLDGVVKESLGQELKSIQRAIDESLKPQSRPLSGWRIRGETSIERAETEGRNVIARLPGSGDPPGGSDGAARAAETVVLGAHYDHLGFGGSNSAAPGEHAVHHGADDNASGTALLVEVARILRQEGPLPRTVLFVAFSGEERGLLGSGHYAANAVVPLADTVAMVNLDMVGRLVGDKLIVHGTGTGTGLESLVDRVAKVHEFEVAKEPGGFGPSDHSSFYAKKIPVLHIFTGSHADYHRPTDTAEKINYDGLVRIAGLVADVVRDLASMPERPAYIEVASKQFARGGGDRPYFGSIPDFGKPGQGYAISGASKDSPAAKAGLKAGDVIVRLGSSAVTGLEDFDSALRKHKGGESIPVVVLRDGAEVTVRVTLDPPK